MWIACVALFVLIWCVGLLLYTRRWDRVLRCAVLHGVSEHWEPASYVRHRAEELLQCRISAAEFDRVVDQLVREDQVLRRNLNSAEQCRRNPFPPMPL